MNSWATLDCTILVWVKFHNCNIGQIPHRSQFLNIDDEIQKYISSNVSLIEFGEKVENYKLKKSKEIKKYGSSNISLMEFQRTGRRLSTLRENKFPGTQDDDDDDEDEYDDDDDNDDDDGDNNDEDDDWLST